jgi:hypothetical protein
MRSQYRSLEVPPSPSALRWAPAVMASRSLWVLVFVVLQLASRVRHQVCRR